MKRILKLLLVPLTTLTFAAVGFAQATPAAPATPAGPAKMEEKKVEKPKANRITGEITSLDAKAGTLKVKANDKEMSFAADTKGAKSALEKAKVGDRVRISYSDKAGKLIAHSVAKAKAKSEAKTPEKKAEPKTEKK